MLVNFDAGVVPATLMKIRSSFRLSLSGAGLLGSLVYFGQTLACPVSGYALTRTQSQRRVLVTAVISNAVATLLFALAPQENFLFVSRALIGFTQAPCIIYGPVWVDEFAPDESKTKWISLLQGSASIGIVMGYALSGAVPGMYSWRWCLCVQAWFIMIPGMVLLFIRGSYVNTKAIDDDDDSDDDDEEGDEEARPVETIYSQLRELSSCYIYIWLTLTLSILYFVVTGIQFWVTDYLVTELGADHATVVMMFAICAVTGPVCGLMFGGWFIDRIGGYRDSARALCNALGVCVLLGIGAVACSVVAASANAFAVVIIFIWLILFFGGALLPTATGISISSVPPHTRPIASAMAMLFYNLVGYAMAPVVCGAIAQSYNLRVGFRFVLLSSSFALLLVTFAWFTALLGYHHLKASAVEDGGVATTFDQDADLRRASTRRVSLGLAGLPSSPGPAGKRKTKRASGVLQYVLAVPEVGYHAGNIGNMFKPVVPEAYLHDIDERFAPQSRFSVAASPGVLSNEFYQYAKDEKDKRTRVASVPNRDQTPSRRSSLGIVWTEINDLMTDDMKANAKKRWNKLRTTVNAMGAFKKTPAGFDSGDAQKMQSGEDRMREIAAKKEDTGGFMSQARAMARRFSTAIMKGESRLEPAADDAQEGGGEETPVPKKQNPLYDPNTAP